MIELLGVGVPRRDRGWLLHRVCTTLEAGELTVVLATAEAERRALLDVITGRRLPDEGRAWIDRLPVMPDSLSRIRRLCADIAPHDRLVARRSVFWNALTPTSGPRALGRLLRLPRRRERISAEAALERVGLRERIGDPVGALSALDRVRLLVAGALAQRAHNIIVRDPDASLSAEEVGVLLALLRQLARSDHLGVVVSLAAGEVGQRFADRVLVLHEGLLVFHGPPDSPAGPPARWREAVLAR